jgi:PEP-CTERM motif
MKMTIRWLTVLSVFICTLIAHANVVGYYNYIFAPGGTLFTSQLDNPPNDLDTLFAGNGHIADGTTISLWNSGAQNFSTASIFSGGSWSVDLTLQAGAGFLLNTASRFTNTFVGNVLNHDGSFLQLPDSLTPPPAYAGPNGIYLLADKTVLVDTGTDIFLNILGRQPNVGEQVITLTLTSTYLGSGNWSGGIPTLNLGDAAWLNIGPVPEPTTLALAGLGGLVAFAVARRQRK